MKKLSYVLGLVAMVVMMTMTSCSNVSEDVQKVCDALEKATDAVENAKSEKDVALAMKECGETMKEADKEVTLTEDDKDALREAFMSYVKTTVQKTADLGLSGASDTEKLIKEAEGNLNKMLDESETLGDLLSKMRL